MKIDFANLKYQHELYKNEIEYAILKVARNCNFIMGDEVFKLEEELQKFTGAKHAITCSSGTDALLLALLALDIKAGDEIITTPFTFIATAETIALLGAKPVFVDIDEKTYNIDASLIEKAITPKTKAIMPVSLYGQPCDMNAIRDIVEKAEEGRKKWEGNNSSTFNLQPSALMQSTPSIKIIIDGAQSFGSTYNGVSDSALGDISCTSFFPAKPLGCYGDGGAVFTCNDKLAEKIKQLRVHGQNKRYHHKYIGLGGRLDTIQAAVLSVKLKHYEKDLALRQEVAKKYDKALRQKVEGRRRKGEYDIVLPFIDKKCTSAYAQYSIRVKGEGKRKKEEKNSSSTFNLQPSTFPRDEIQQKLKQLGVPTAVHYPMPLHLQECFKYLGYKNGDFSVSELVSKEILSLPMNPYLSDEEVEYIVSEI